LASAIRNGLIRHHNFIARAFPTLPLSRQEVK
jgi:hypothetical protein